MRTLPQSLFISLFELPVSSESQEEDDQTGTLSAGSGDSATDEPQKVAVEGPGIVLREKTSPSPSPAPSLPALMRARILMDASDENPSGLRL